MFLWSEWPLAGLAALFFAAAVIVCVDGIWLARLSSQIARQTGLGQAMMGALFLGAVTSLSGITTSVTAAIDGAAELAASNAIGGIAAQTAFLAIADLFHRRANLEHAAASDENMFQGALLIALCGLPLLAAMTPDIALLGVHPATPMLLIAYVGGQRIARAAQQADAWRPAKTEETQDEETEENAPPEPGEERETLAALWTKFALSALTIGITGYFLAKSGIALAAKTGINESIVGGLLTAVATSLPELVTAIAAVRAGALNLAVGNIIGGNAFDVIFFSVADLAYRGGSLYHAMGSRPEFLLAITIVMSAVLLMGMLRRQKHGVANIGFESFLILLIYAAGFLVISLSAM